MSEGGEEESGSYRIVTKLFCRFQIYPVSVFNVFISKTPCAYLRL